MMGEVLWALYGIGLVFWIGLAMGDSGRPNRWEVVTIIGWPVLIPVAFACRWWGRRQTRRWNALTYEQRDDLNKQGKGVLEKRWPYVYTPHVPRGYGKRW
jgi:hypothetical protein